MEGWGKEFILCRSVLSLTRRGLPITQLIFQVNLRLKIKQPSGKVKESFPIVLLCNPCPKAALFKGECKSQKEIGWARMGS